VVYNTILSRFDLKVRGTFMLFLVIGLGAGLLALSLAAPANVGGAHAVSAETAAAELSAMAKKPTEEMAKKKPKEKIEYMRAVPAK
jgi:hypothetical protein